MKIDYQNENDLVEFYHQWTTSAEFLGSPSDDNYSKYRKATRSIDLSVDARPSSVLIFCAAWF